MKHLFAAILILTAATATALDPVTVSMRVARQNKELITTYQAHVKLRDHTGADNAVTLILVGMEKEGIRSYRVASISKRSRQTLAPYKAKTAQLEVTGERKSRYTLLLMAFKDGELVASEWDRRAFEIDPAKFIDAKVGELITKEKE